MSQTVAGSEANRQIAFELIRAMSENDVATMDELLDADVRQWIPWSAQQRVGGIELPIEGAEAVKQMAGRGEDRYEYIRFEPLFAVADENGAAVFAETDSKLKDGRSFKNRYAFFVRIVDGRVTELWEHPDTAWSFEFFGI
jgi:ketosteroid isomerase-like protein